MWPWEHAIVGYLAYSLVCHAYYRASPGGLEVLAVGLAGVLPDLIDKPLAWEVAVFETGYGIGHSILFAAPLAVVAGLAARSLGRPRVGVAFGLAYLLHLPSDVVDAYVREGRYIPELALWPVAVPAGGDHHGGFRDHLLVYLGRYAGDLLEDEPSTYVLAMAGLGGAVFLLWLYDGAPVLREAVALVRRLARDLLDPVAG